jgi:hypothetical protein
MYRTALTSRLLAIFAPQLKPQPAMRYLSATCTANRKQATQTCTASGSGGPFGFAPGGGPLAANLTANGTYLETGRRGELRRDTGGSLRETRRGTRELWRGTGGFSRVASRERRDVSVVDPAFRRRFSLESRV